MLTFRARWFVTGSPGLLNRLSRMSADRLMSHSWTFDASSVSGSRESGSSRKELRLLAVERRDERRHADPAR